MTLRVYVTPRMLKWARKRQHMTVFVISRLMGVSVDFIDQWEAGSESPTLEQAQKLASITDVPFGFLFLSHPLSCWHDMRYWWGRLVRLLRCGE